MTEFIARNHGCECYEIIIKTTNHDHYKAAEDFARRLIDHAKPATDNNVGCKWISAMERLPEIDGRYLCNYRFTNHRGMAFVAVLDYYATDKIPHFQHTLGDTTMEVTHWMPLPAPPEGE